MIDLQNDRRKGRTDNIMDTAYQLTHVPKGTVLHERGPDGPRTLADVEHRFDIPLAHAMETQRAVRRLLPDPVDLDLIRRCIELALKGPSASNEQTWHFMVITDPEKKAALGRRYASTVTHYKKSVLKKYPDDPSIEKMFRAVDWQVEHFNEIPVIVVPCVEGGRLPGVPIPFIGRSSYFGSIYPAVQNFLLAARSVGLGSTLVVGPLFPLGKIRRILGLPRSVTPICILPVGWPEGRYGPTTRRSVDDVMHINNWSR